MRTLRVRRASLRAGIDTEPGARSGTRADQGDEMSTDKTLLEIALEHAAAHPDRTFLTQPLGGGPVADYTWGQVMDQSRRMAAHLQSLGLQPGARVAILSKNCAHFFMAELAIWLGGYTTVAIFPTESAETIRYVLDPSDASPLFAGKLDTWEHPKPGGPA